MIMVGIREFPPELDEKALQVAAEAAYMAFQRDVRRSHEYLPEPRPFTETEAYLRDCYVEMCRAAFAAYAAAVPPEGSGRNLADANPKIPQPGE